MLNKIKNKINLEYYSTLYRNKGFKTNRKIIVFESDDWGNVRMPSKNAYENLLKKGVRVDKCPYAQNDTIASTEDLMLLFDLLLKYRDINGNPPVITANTIVANPDFDKIKASNYQEYFYEPITETFKRYSSTHSLSTWFKGMDMGVFHPQFHGREHLNVAQWLYMLQKGVKEFVVSFDYGYFGLSGRVLGDMSSKIPASFLIFKDVKEQEEHFRAIREGMDLFKDIFGYSSESFIATNHRWNVNHERELALKGVRYLQTDMLHRSPYAPKKEKYIYHYVGQKNTFGQIYLLRNSYFEPISNPFKDWVDSCLCEIEKAFNNKRPAIICTHRVNFAGYLNENNRDRTLVLLDKLLKKINELWPDVEYFSSDNLGRIINESNNGL
jgi:hypothetical protein